MISNDERIEENSFLNSDVLDDDSIDNRDASSTNQSGITDFEITSPLSLQNDEEFSESIWSLNVKQRQIFDYVLTWTKEKVKQKSSI